MEDLLRSLDLLHFLPAFEEHEITSTDLLLDFTEEMFKELFPPLGARSKVKGWVNKEKQRRCGLTQAPPSCPPIPTQQFDGSGQTSPQGV